MGARSSLAVAAGDVTGFVLRRVLGRRGGQLPGRVALAVDPGLIGELSGKLRRGSIVVCGTNGKTTTNNIVASSIEACGQRVLCNRDGDNMMPGVATALLPGGEADWAVIEADELSCIHILPALRPRYLLLLNLFRDQLDRAGEIDHVQDVLVEALARSPETTLVACGDDPLSQGVALRAAAQGTRTLAFGIGEDLGLAPERVAEARFCQVCGAPLSYDYRTYAQLGAFRCPNGDFSRPELDYVATGVSVSRKGVSFVAGDVRAGTSAEVHASFGGTYMVYNLLAAFAVASLAGVGPAAFQHVLDGYHPENGRLQRFRARGREVILNLAKNPTGFNQNISLLLADERPKAAYVVVNDDFNDGKDISWIWDMDLERLAADPEIRVMCGGSRANDVQVRCKYAGISATLAATVSEALEQAADLPLDRPLYVLCNYSALWPAKAELEREGERL
ncbi:MAG: MurT ligase domain-containing protein [Atopobiaceae bacterium]|jgi:UDP-N-acetylmuramyl tripeptide synthase|nr:MurT ligase domain-containing protein [Atopobiaceae bacterium]MCH4120327.1 MurT ligase domain-containing protein [Atopobiaceae bacterium]MCI1318830.1 MurT ligase domain-containing protein [Atopobiaceae bacterium]MCI1432317.1 MurT ligase domain-containing protein [Atopobiaceae bacterium]MCI1470775.1 MurT ligase domain-containing protein [Atopobiaceae bacterium]